MEDEVICIPFPSSYRDCMVLVQSDCYRYTGKIISVPKILLKSFFNNWVAFSLWFRLSQYKGIMYRFTRFCLGLISRKYGIYISPETLVGYGFYIGHFCGTIVNPTAIIGNNVNISQFTTIGSNKGCSAIIGDNVYIGPSVCIVENVHIGSNSTIGAGAVVVKDVAPSVTVAGVPARVISCKEPGRFCKKRWKYEV